MMLLMISALLALIVPAQASDLPVLGTIGDLKEGKKVYLAADNSDARDRMKDELDKVITLEVVGDPAAADFVLEYIVLDRSERQSVLGGSFAIEKGEMRAWFKRPDGTKVVAWSETERWDGGRGKKPDRKLAEKFAKALKKSHG